MHKPDPPSPLESLAVFLSTGLGIGLTPIAPGTLGALAGVPVTMLVYLLPRVGAVPAEFFQAAACLVLVLAGVPICSAGQWYFTRKDPVEVVWDEIATVPVVFFLVPNPLNPWVLAAGFGLHRLFDITKPPPCRRFERLSGGLGIMADDVGAAVYAGLTLHLLVWLGLFS